MLVELGYFTLKVKDVVRAQRFYGDAFGWEFEGGPQGAHVKNTKLPVGIAPGGPVDISFVYFKVPNLDAAIAHISELGGTARGRSESPSGLSAICTDDQGTEFSLWQPAPGFE
ncbi:MAG: VOC family protein [Rhizomicrobium sp.]|jgi:predicted enzyme related to lactoylglutathione lyase